MANLIFIKAEGTWHSLCFDFADIYWHQQAEPPQSFRADELEAEYLLVNLGERFGVQGERVERISSSPVPGGSEVRIEFTNRVVVFTSVNDRTTYAFHPRA